MARSSHLCQPPSPAHSAVPFHRITQLSLRFWYYSAVRLLAGHHRSFRLPAYRAAYPTPLGTAASPPGVTPESSAPCRPQTPWYERWMRNAFASIVQARPCPLLGRPVRLRDGSHRLRPGASPQTLQIRPRDRHPVLLPFPPEGRRGVTPAFGYGAPHPSPSGTSTHLNTSLPSAHYDPIRQSRGHAATSRTSRLYAAPSFPTFAAVLSTRAVDRTPVGPRRRPVMFALRYQAPSSYH